jgi:hypothetical protein
VISVVQLRIHAPPPKPPPTSIVTAPFTIVRDDRESDAGWTFNGLIERRKKKDYRVVVPIREARLETGDYTIAGFESLICIERKTLSDLFGSLSAPRSDPTRRERFKQEHERMAAIIAAGGHACVVVEASFPDVYLNPPIESGLNPNSVLGTFHNWAIRYGVSWVWGGDRRGAELAAYGRLKACWEVYKDRLDGESIERGLPLWRVFAGEAEGQGRLEAMDTSGTNRDITGNLQPKSAFPTSLF